MPRGHPTVSWRLSKDDLGNAPAKAALPGPRLAGRVQESLAQRLYRLRSDRGHMCSRIAIARRMQSSKSHLHDDEHGSPVSGEQTRGPGTSWKCTSGTWSIRTIKSATSSTARSGWGASGGTGPWTGRAAGRWWSRAATWKVVMVLDEDVSGLEPVDRGHEHPPDRRHRPQRSYARTGMVGVSGDGRGGRGVDRPDVLRQGAGRRDRPPEGRTR